MERAVKKAIFFIAVCGATLLCACRGAGYTVFAPVPSFSGDILFSAKISGGRAQYAYDGMREIIDGIDEQVSLTDSDSDLSRFNNAVANERVEVGKYAYELFVLSLRYYELTGGAFNCAVSPLAELWHTDATSLGMYAPDIDGSHISPPLPTAQETAETAAYCRPDTVSAWEENGRYYLEKSDGRVKLDFGGIAKGYAVDKCVEVLERYSVASALIDISGNAYFYGRYIGGDGDWRVGIMSPRPRAAQTLSRGYVCAVSLDGDVSAVTSGDYMRYYIHDNDDGSAVYVPHILGADGVPIGVVSSGDGWKNDDEWVISATVTGESSAACDALSTAVCALGMEEGGALLQKLGYKGLIFTEKRYTIIGDIRLHDPDVYDGHKDYEYHEL